MGLLMTVESGSVRLTAKLDLDELEALRLEGERNSALKAAVAVAFETPEFAEVKRVTCGPFLAAVETILREAKAGLSATTYYVYDSPMPGLIPKGSSSGASVAVAGQIWFIMGGANSCTVTKYAKDENGGTKQVSIEDARHIKKIKKDDGSTLEIRTRSNPGRTLKWLRHLSVGLAGLPPEADVMVTVG
jgi:hypothetical protein